MGLTYTNKVSFVGPGHQELLKLTSRTDSTYLVKIDLKKTNAIVSHLFVKSGTGTVDVKYYNFTTDGDDQEKDLIGDHGTIDALNSPISDVQIAAMASKPYAEVIVTGTVEFSLFGSAVHSIPGLALDQNGNVAPLRMIDGKLVVDASFTPSGLKLGGRVSHPVINENTWVDITPIPLDQRRAVNIQNPSETYDIKLNYGNAISGFNGVTVYARGERQYTIEGNVKIYAKLQTGGGSLILDVEEIA